MTLASPNTRTAQACAAPPAEPAPAAGRRWRRRGSLALRLAVSAALLLALLSQVELGRVAAVVSGAHAGLLVLLLAMFLAERCLGAYRWHLLLRTQAIKVSFATTLRATFLGGFVGTFLPGGVGVEAVRVAAMTRATDLASATSSVLVDRILGSAALLGIVLLALAVTPQPVPGAVAVAAWAAMALLVAGSAMLAHPRLRDGLTRLVPGRRLAEVRREVRHFATAMGAMRRRPMTLLHVGGLSILFQVLRVSIAPVAAVALGLELPLTLLLIYVPIIMFIMMLPISLGGLGVREAAYVYFFGYEHITPEQAIALSLVIGLFTLIVQLPGAVVCLTGVRPRRSHVSPPPPQPTPQEPG
ncbi:MAG: lysylphosphatidylglycerol synthase transmembrane domain-containing protein [Phycisphaeraceae bacterium]